MNCPSCGTILAEGSTFCPVCGSPIVSTNVTPPSAAKQSIRQSLKAAPLILTVLCIVALIVSFFVVINTSIEDLSVLTMLSTISGEDLDEFDDIKDQAKANYKEMSAQFEYYEDDLSKKDQKKVEKCLDDFKALSKSLSIQNMKDFVSSAKSVASIDEVEEMGLDEEVEALDDISKILDIVFIVILVFMLICLACCACGGFFRITGLVITGLVFSLLYGLSICGIGFMILFGVIEVALIVVLSAKN